MKLLLNNLLTKSLNCLETNNRIIYYFTLLFIFTYTYFHFIQLPFLTQNEYEYLYQYFSIDKFNSAFTIQSFIAKQLFLPLLNLQTLSPFPFRIICSGISFIAIFILFCSPKKNNEYRLLFLWGIMISTTPFLLTSRGLPNGLIYVLQSTACFVTISKIKQCFNTELKSFTFLRIWLFFTTLLIGKIILLILLPFTFILFLNKDSTLNKAKELLILNCISIGTLLLSGILLNLAYLNPYEIVTNNFQNIHHTALGLWGIASIVGLLILIISQIKRKNPFYLLLSISSLSILMYGYFYPEHHIINLVLLLALNGFTIEIALQEIKSYLKAKNKLQIHSVLLIILSVLFWVFPFHDALNLFSSRHYSNVIQIEEQVKQINDYKKSNPVETIKILGSSNDTNSRLVQNLYLSKKENLIDQYSIIPSDTIAYLVPIDQLKLLSQFSIRSQYNVGNLTLIKLSSSIQKVLSPASTIEEAEIILIIKKQEILSTPEWINHCKNKSISENLSLNDQTTKEALWVLLENKLITPSQAEILSKKNIK